MKHFLSFAVLLLAVSFVGAYETDGMKILSVEVKSPSIFDRLAIIPDKPYYLPGETATVAIPTSVPCDTKYVYFVVETSSTKMYSLDISSLFKNNVCVDTYDQAFKVTMIVPKTPGNYNASVEYRSSTNILLYKDVGLIVVKDPNAKLVCPTGYSTSWNNFQRIEFGYLQNKITYHYAATDCKQTQYETFRINCDTGYEVKGNLCSPKSTTPPACGDKVVQSGEQCDLGFANGACPSNCNAFCSLSQCEQLPTPAAEAPTTPQNDEDSNNSLLVGSIVSVIGVGGVIYSLRGKRK